MAAYENPFIRGMMGARQQNEESAMNGLRQQQGLLGIQQAMGQQQEMQKMQQLKGLLGQKLQAGDMEGVNGILAQIDPVGVARGMQPKAPKWTETTLTQPDGTKKRGYVDINSPTPETTFRPLGVEPVKREFVNGMPVNPYTQTAPVNDINKAFGRDASGNVVPNAAVQQYELNKAAKGAARQTTVVNPALDPFKNEKALRDEFRGNAVVKNADEMAGAFRLIDTAYKNPSPANDLAMATKYMKVLDPTSVVRESELALAMGAVGLLDKVYNYANLVASGQKLTPTQRKDFYDSAKAINEEFQKGKSGVASQYKGIAQQYKLSPQNVTLERETDGWSIQKVD